MNEAIRIIKKYPNRRLYDTTTSVYITFAVSHEKIAFVHCIAAIFSWLTANGLGSG